MTTENYLAFKQYEQKLQSALHSNYARFTAKELEAFSQVLSNHRGTPLSRQERSCPHCLLAALKKVAEEYFKFEQSPRGKALLKQKDNGEESEADGGEKQE